MEIREINVKANMDGFGIPNPISGVLFGGEDQAHKFIVAEQNGEAFAGTVSAKFLRYADDQTVPLTGSIEDGKATVTLIENCYYLPGRFKLTIYVTANGSTTAVYCCMGTVDRTDGRTTVDPSGEINLDVTDLINQINTAVGSIPPEYTALLNTIAPIFSTSTAYKAGEYVWNGGTLYQFTADHAAGAWVGTDATAAVIGKDVSELKSALENDYVPLVHSNLFPQAELLQTGKYVSVTDGHIVYGNNATYDSYIIPVDGVSKYAFTKTYFALLLEDDEYTAVGELIKGATIIDSTGASYIAFSIAPSLNPPSTYIVSKGTVLADTDTLPELEPLPSMQAVINRVGNLVDGKTKYSSDSADNMASGDSIVLPVETLTELKKKSKVVFEANISTFSKVDVGYTYGTTMALNTLFGVFEITESVVNYYQGYFSSGITETQNHGLTLNGNIQVILEQTDTASCLLTIISDGEEYQHEFSIFELVRSGRPFALSVGSTLTNCKLTWTCGDFDKKIWMFGDSYFSYASNRWPYFLHQHGYDKNVLMNGFPGEGSAAARQSFGFLLNFATPMFSAMCTGMNDGTDSDSAPSSTWVAQRDLFLQYCTNNNITPILATIPSVPNINHEQKNAWVRSSGYRYIDFAKAVGATSSGVWFDGMLSTDNVHPTAKGARALFARVLLDFPEIMIDN